MNKSPDLILGSNANQTTMRYIATNSNVRDLKSQKRPYINVQQTKETKVEYNSQRKTSYEVETLRFSTSDHWSHLVGASITSSTATDIPSVL